MADTNEFDITDSVGNTVEADITIEADPLIKADAINGDPVIADDAGYGASIPAKSIRFDTAHGKLRRSGELYTGTIEYLKLYDRNRLIYDDAILLITASNLVITNGELIVRQENVISGLLSSLEMNTDYWFYLFNVDLTAISIGKIQPVLE